MEPQYQHVEPLLEPPVDVTGTAAFGVSIFSSEIDPCLKGAV